MAELDTIAGETKKHADRIGEADLVVALPNCQNKEQLDAAVDGLRAVLPVLVPGGKTVILHPDAAIAPAETNQDQPAEETAFHLFPHPMTPVRSYHEESFDQGLRTLLQVGRALGARAFIMMSLDTSPESLRGLAEPVLDSEYDLAVPLYARHKFDSLINTGIVYPLTRATYGARLRYPMAADLALSGQLAEQYLQPEAPGGQMQSGWITTKAVCLGLQVCQVHRNFAPAPGVSEAADLSASLAQVLGSLFLGLEQNVAFWQKVRGSDPVRTFGRATSVEVENTSVDVREMIETFQRGCKDLLDIWAMALSPAPLLDLKKLARLPMDEFRLADSLYVRVLYEFILGYRQRVISREHLLRSMTPIYLAWVASYALEVQDALPGAVESRVEKLCAAFEEGKPYLFSRWRWPDRFNP